MSAVSRNLLTAHPQRPAAFTLPRLDNHGALWSLPESKWFRGRFRTFNTQIWAYHWLQAAVYDVQLMGDGKQQPDLMPKAIAFYHGYLRPPPEAWQYMPMMPDAAPESARRVPAAAAICANLDKLHDHF